MLDSGRLFENRLPVLAPLLVIRVHQQKNPALSRENSPSIQNLPTVLIRSEFADMHGSTPIVKATP